MTVGELKLELANIDNDVVIYDEFLNEIEIFDFVEYPTQIDSDYLMLYPKEIK